MAIENRNEKTKEKPIKVMLLTLGVFLVFFMFGFVDNTRGSVMSSILSQFGFTYTEGGTIFSGVYFGFFISVCLFGIFGGNIGNRNLTILGTLLLASGSIFFSYSYNFLFLLISMVVVGLGLGSLEIGLNAFLVDLFTDSKKRAKYLLLGGFFHSLGSMMAPYLGGKAIDFGIAWHSIYFYLGLIVLILVGYMVIIGKPQKILKNQNVSMGTIIRVITQKEMLLFYVLIFGYVGMEVGMSTWGAQYIKTQYDFTLKTATLYTSAFFGCIMVGRFIGSFVINRIGHIESMLWGTVIAILLFTAGIFGGKTWSVCLPLTGFFIATIFQTTAALVANFGKENLTLRYGVLFVFAGLGGMFGPWFIGLLSDVLSIQKGVYVSIISLSLSILFSLLFLKARMEGRNNGNYAGIGVGK